MSMTPRQSNVWSPISKVVFLTFCLIVGVLLIYKHRIHVLGLLPFAFLSTCIVMHLFMHHGQGRHFRHWRGDQEDAETRAELDHT